MSNTATAQSPDVEYNSQWTGTNGVNGPFQPYGIALNNSGHVYVSEAFNNRVSKFDTHATTVQFAGTQGYAADPLLNFFTERYAQAYAREVIAFIDAVAAGREPAPSGHDGLQAQRLADAATQSWKTGKPVKLPS